jgi:hypothetical protein
MHYYIQVLKLLYRTLRTCSQGDGVAGFVCGCSTPPYLEVSLSKVLTTLKFGGTLVNVELPLDLPCEIMYRFYELSDPGQETCKVIDV